LSFRRVELGPHQRQLPKGRVALAGQREAVALPIRGARGICGRSGRRRVAFDLEARLRFFSLACSGSERPG